MSIEAERRNELYRDGVDQRRRALEKGGQQENALVAACMTFLSIMLPVILLLNDRKDGFWSLVAIAGLVICLVGCYCAVSIYKAYFDGYEKVVHSYNKLLANPSDDQKDAVTYEIVAIGDCTLSRIKPLKKVLYWSVIGAIIAVVVSAVHLLPCMCEGRVGNQGIEVPLGVSSESNKTNESLNKAE